MPGSQTRAGRLYRVDIIVHSGWNGQMHTTPLRRLRRWCPHSVYITLERAGYSADPNQVVLSFQFDPARIETHEEANSNKLYG